MGEAVDEEKRVAAKKAINSWEKCMMINQDGSVRLKTSGSS